MYNNAEDFLMIIVMMTSQLMQNLRITAPLTIITPPTRSSWSWSKRAEKTSPSHRTRQGSSHSASHQQVFLIDNEVDYLCYHD